MFRLDSALLFLLVLRRWDFIVESSSIRSNKWKRPSILSKVSDTADALGKAGYHYIKNEKRLDKVQTHFIYANVLSRVFDKFESYRGQVGLDLQLQKVKVYYAVDYSNDPVLSYYPEVTKNTKNTPPTVLYKIKNPNYFNLVRDFLLLFSHDKDCKNVCKYSSGELNANLPNVVMVFMDPNTCANHVLELNKQEKEAKLSSMKLNKVFRLFEKRLNFYRDDNTVNVLVPLSESLVYATNYGGNSFKGTPVFTTNPPIYVSKKEGMDNFDKFDKDDKLLVFFSPSEAKEFYKKIRWNKTLKDEASGKVYKIWANSPPFRPDVRATSLEKLYKKVHTSEPHWGYLLEFVPPTVRLEKRTEFLVKESKKWVLVPWYRFQKLFKRLWN